MTAFIDDHHEEFGVEPICRVLTEHGATSTYDAARDRPPSARASGDERVRIEVRRVHAASGGRYGARTVSYQLRREHVQIDGSAVAWCTVERLMAADGLRGCSRGCTVRTTRPDTTAARPADLVEREFTAAAPNRAMGRGFHLCGHLRRVRLRRVRPRRVLPHDRQVAARPHHDHQAPPDALDMAKWHHARARHHVAGVVHHRDAGSPYTATRYTHRLTEASAPALMSRSKRRQRHGRVGDRALPDRTGVRRRPLARRR
ncbi:MAG: IS3 family transposase [Pseudonocardia sp.]